MSTAKLVGELRHLSMIFSSLGDFKKANTISEAADRLEDLEAANNKLCELVGCPPDALEAYVKYEREKKQAGV